MTRLVEYVLLSVLLMPPAYACGASTSTNADKPYSVVLRALSDEGEPVVGAEFTSGTRSIGKSDPKGALAITLRGAEGQNVTVGLNCPDGFVGPERPSTFKLTEVRRVDQTRPSTLGVDMTCMRKLRDVVVIVRTTNAPSLPVDVGGKALGQTDTSGTAHVHLQIDREVRTLSVNLGTTEAPLLRPQNPSRVFELNGQDALLLLEQSFTSDRKPSARRVAAVSKPQQHVPYQIRSGK